MILLFFHQPAVHRHGDHLPRDELPALLERRFRRYLQPAATGYLHADNGDAFDVVLPKDLRQLFGIIRAVQFRAAHKGDVPLDEPLVEGGVGVGGAVGGDEEPHAVKIRRVHRHQLDLHRPLGKVARLLGLRIISEWSAAGCRWSLEKCGMRGCLPFTKATFFSKCRMRTAFFLLRVKKPPSGVSASADAPGRHGALGFCRRKRQLRSVEIGRSASARTI